MDTTTPKIVIGLADPSNMGKLLNDAALVDGQEVEADHRGLVMFRAKITDGGSGIRNVTIQVPHAFGSEYGSPTPQTFIGAGWPTKNETNGKEGRVTVTAADYAGNHDTVSVSVVLKK
jgi:hypothetical protein